MEDLLWIPAIAEEARTKPAGWVKVVLFMAVVAVPMIVCVALGREPIETSMLGVVTALAMLLLLRPGEGR